MPAAFIANDVAHVTGSDVFGESVTWDGNTVTVIFDDEDIEVQLGEGVAQIQNQPMMTGQTSDFSGIADGDAHAAGAVRCGALRDIDADVTLLCELDGVAQQIGQDLENAPGIAAIVGLEVPGVCDENV